MENQSIVIDDKGNEIPRNMVDPLKLKRHDIVEVSHRQIRKLEKQMQKAKKQLEKRINDYKKLKAKRLDVETKGKKGGLVLTNLARDKQIEISNHEVKDLNDIRFEAEEVLRGITKDLGGDQGQQLYVMFSQAINLEKKGRVDMAAMNRMMELKIKHHDWSKFKDLMQQAQETVGTRSYVNFRERDESGQWKTINLNFSSM